MEEYNIEGESLWRNQGYGVENHSFDIENFCLCDNNNYELSPDPKTDACPYEIYSTEEMLLYEFNEDAAYNTLKIRPYSVNDASDYRNGVTALDLVAIQAHLLNDPPFEERLPTEDAPFRYISADADNDRDVDEDDIEMTEDLIQFSRDDLSRNSWEWVHKDEVENAEERFIETPYEFVISYNWPDEDGIILPAITTNQIEADNDKYFTFRSTKIGDIIASSSAFITSLNSWVCGSGSYFNEDFIESRATTKGLLKKIRPGSIVTIAIFLDTYEDIIGLELPIFFSEDNFDLVDVQFKDGFSPRWNYVPDLNMLTILDYSKDLRPISGLSGKILEFTLKTRQEIMDIQNAIYWHKERNVELIGTDINLLASEPRIQILDVRPPDLFVEIRYDEEKQVVYIESPFDQEVNITLFNNQGYNVNEERKMIFQGGNFLPLIEHLIPGSYFIRICGEKQIIGSKVIID